MEEKQPTWQEMQDLIKQIGEDNKSGSMTINANVKDIGKLISDLCDEIYRLKTALKLAMELNKDYQEKIKNQKAAIEFQEALIKQMEIENKEFRKWNQPLI